MRENTDGIIQEGKSVQEAIRLGLATLGMPREDVHVIVLDEGPKGILKLLGGHKARVKIVPVANEDERVRRLVDGLLSKMGLGGQVEVSCSEKRIEVLIETAGVDGLLIGRHGQTLDSLQHVVERMVNRGRRERRKVIVDVGGYRRRRGRTERSRPQRQDRKPRNRTGGGRRSDNRHEGNFAHSGVMKTGLNPREEIDRESRPS